MKLRIVAALVLLAAIAAAVWAAGILRTGYDNALAQHDAQTRQVQALKDQAAGLQQTLDSLTTESAEENEAQAARLLQEAEELKAQLDALRAEIETMKTHLEENQDAIADAQAELTYLQGVYDALEEGLKQVEAYLAGD